MWKNIVNPKTGRKVNLNSRIGKSVLRNYIKQLGGAAAGAKEDKCRICSENLTLEEHHKVTRTHCRHFFHIECIKKRKSCPECSVSLEGWHPTCYQLLKKPLNL